MMFLSQVSIIYILIGIMATIKSVQRYHLKSDGTKQIAIRISHLGENRFVDSGFSVEPKHFKNGEVTKSFNGWAKINQRLKNLENQYWDRVFELEKMGDYSVDEIVNTKTPTKESETFISYARDYNKKFKIQNSPNSFRRHKTVINKLEEYSGSDLKFRQITSTFLKKYIAHLHDIGNNPNTINGNLKFIRSVWNDAQKNGVHSIFPSPFLHIKLPKKKTTKERLTPTELKKLEGLKLKKGNWNRLARDSFIASFNLGGIRFADFCCLKKSNIEDGKLTYTMNKTGQRLEIECSPQLCKLIDYYHGSREVLLFPLIEDDDLKLEKTELFKVISSKNTLVNKALKRVAKKAKINKRLTFHIARHSFADISRKGNISIYDISKMLGHANIGITENYLDSTDQERMDSAFRKVLNY
ncbi:site-specific integrase [Gracilimonas tropica]|uniref:site-specific integrase n=1 Tax=Gracilimonas tropica TaxID=454600 RepID=UPI00039CEA57|nr:site-specific integrase [Gracilimonas tropica]